MKTLISSILTIILTANAVFASISDTIGTLNDNPIKAQVELTLENSSWKEAIASNASSTFQFNKLGGLDIITKENDGTVSYKNKVWTIAQDKGVVYLTLTDVASGNKELFEVAQLADSTLRLLETTTKKTFTLNLQSTFSKENYDFMTADLVGSWAAEKYPFDINTTIGGCGTLLPMEKAFFNYTFNANGTYTRVLGSDIKTITEKGTWSITKDGQFVKLTNDKNRTELVQIQGLNDRKLTLNQAINTNDAETLFCTAQKTITFNKLKDVVNTNM